MIRRRSLQKTRSAENTRAFDDFHEWVLSLPWVVERTYSLATPGVRSFGVDCEPLGRRQLWLVTGLQHHLHWGENDVAVILPVEAAREVEDAGWGRPLVPMPAHHVLMSAYDSQIEHPHHTEALVLIAYSHAMS